MTVFETSNLLSMFAPGYIIAVAVPLSIIDIRQRRLPNKIVLPGLLITLIFDFAASAVGNRWSAFGVAMAYWLISFLLFWGMNAIGAIGMGDVKLISLICMSLGWFDWTWPLLALVAGFGVASMVVVLSLAAGKLRAKNTIPLGPYLLFGFSVSLTALVVS